MGFLEEHGNMGTWWWWRTNMCGFLESKRERKCVSNCACERVVLEMKSTPSFDVIVLTPSRRLVDSDSPESG